MDDPRCGPGLAVNDQDGECRVVTGEVERKRVTTPGQVAAHSDLRSGRWSRSLGVDADVKPI